MQHDIASVLEDILEAAQYIADDTHEATFEDFLQDRRVRQLVERNFTIIGEALNRLRRHTPGSVAQIGAHEQIIGFRNVLVHGYDVIDPTIVWSIVEHRPYTIGCRVERLLAEIDDKDTTLS